MVVSVSFTPRPLYSRGKNSRYEFVGPRISLDRVEREKSLFLAGKSRIGRAARGPLLYRLSSSNNNNNIRTINSIREELLSV
jgi:hypothetical protein